MSGLLDIDARIYIWILSGVFHSVCRFDRFTMVRVRKVLERYSQATNGLEGLIDMHTGNDYAYAGQKVTDAVAYANHWAYVDSLWIGEMFSYDSEPYNWVRAASIVGKKSAPPSLTWRRTETRMQCAAV